MKTRARAWRLPDGRRSAVAVLFALLAGCGGDKVVDPGNHRPHVQGIVALPAVVARGGATRLTALASDADDDPLTYRWSAPSGAFSDSVDGAIFWHAPEEAGLVRVKVVVSDGFLADSASINIAVGSGTVAVTSDPPGFPILLNGVATGKVTPDSLRKLPIDDYSVELSSDLFKFAPAETSFTLQDGGIVSVRFRIPPVTTEIVDTGPDLVDEIGGLAYYPGGIGVFYTARAGTDTTLRSASLVPTHGGTNGRVLARPVALLESIAARSVPGGLQALFVSADHIRVAGLRDSDRDGLVEQIDSVVVLGNVFGESYGPALSPDGRILGYALAPSTPPNDDDLLLAGDFDGFQVLRPRLVATNRRGNSVQFGPDNQAFFESGGEIHQSEIDTLLSFPAERITDTGGNASAPAPSPDGRFLAYVDARGSLKLLALQIDKTITLLPEISTTRVAWSPNGLELLIADNGTAGNARLRLVYNLPIR